MSELDGQAFNKFEESTYSISYVGETLVEGDTPRLRAEKSLKGKELRISDDDLAAEMTK